MNMELHAFYSPMKFVLLNKKYQLLNKLSD